MLEDWHIKIVEKVIGYITENERNEHLQEKKNQILKKNSRRNDKRCQKK